MFSVSETWIWQWCYKTILTPVSCGVAYLARSLDFYHPMRASLYHFILSQWLLDCRWCVSFVQFSKNCRFFLGFKCDWLKILVQVVKKIEQPRKKGRETIVSRCLFFYYSQLFASLITYMHLVAKQSLKSNMLFFSNSSP